MESSSEGSFCKGTRLKTYLSLLMVAMLLAVPSALMFNSSTSDADYSGESNVVVYHPYYGSAPVGNSTSYNGYGSYADIEVTYYGSVVSTEYNPQVWDKTKWYPIESYSKNNTVVFTGWAYAVYSGDGGSRTLTGTTAEKYLPGQVMTDGQIFNAKDKDGKVHVYAKWDTLDNTITLSRNTNLSSISFTSGDVYTNVVVVSSNRTLTFNSMSSSTEGFTIRGGTLSIGGSARTMTNHLIVDSASIIGSFSSGTTHGDGAVGLFACGFDLVIGTGVTNGTNSSHYNYPQLFGGRNGGTINSTNLIVHSGTYGNVVAGSSGGTINGDTSVVLKDVTILDTLIGASSNTGVVNGSTYIYATALNMPGDYYEERYIDSSYNGAGPSKNIKMEESTIITGGSNNGKVTKDTHVYISGESVVWDVQGAGRRGQSTVADTAYVEISGNALVKHVVNGSITDGLNGSSGGVSGSNQCVKNTNITVKDSAKVASVFGAGYDTFYKATYSSMYNGGIITINIEGDCTVGYVYGGGYRGSVGYMMGNGTNPDSIDAVIINLSGGKVLHDVFGGGRGGVDKVCHKNDGTLSWGDSEEDSTGFSKMFANEIIITLNGTEVRGNIYGGGESMPYITGGSYTREQGVASTECGTLSINLLSGTVAGDVYGGGKGISDVAGGPTIPVMKSDGSIHEIPWLSNNPTYAGYSNSSSSTYLGYASVTASYIHIQASSIDLGTTDVYGGGAFGTVTSTHGGIIVDISSSSVHGKVFGGGLGSNATDKTNVGKVTVKTIDININNSNVGYSTVGYSVMGGGQYAFTDTDGVDISIRGSSKINGDIHAGGLGYSSGSTHSTSMDADNRSILLDAATVNGSITGEAGSVATSRGPLRMNRRTSSRSWSSPEPSRRAYTAEVTRARPRWIRRSISVRPHMLNPTPLPPMP